MKSQVTRMLTLGMALAAAAAVHAQDKTVTANVPFAFYMGSNQMPQGAYRVDELMHGAVISLTGKDSIKSATTHEVIGIKMEQPGRLVFRCYGQSCFLAEVWTGGTVGHGLITSSREKELAHYGAAPALAVIRLAMHQ